MQKEKYPGVQLGSSYMRFPESHKNACYVHADFDRNFELQVFFWLDFHLLLYNIHPHCIGT